MSKRYISSLQFSSLLCFPIFSFYSGISSYNILKYSGVSSYLSILFAYLFGLLVSIIFFTIFNYKRNCNILEKNICLFGKRLGTFINIIMNTCFFIIGAILLYYVSLFVTSQLLNMTYIVAFMFLIGIIVVYNVSCGICNIVQVSFLFLFFIFFLMGVYYLELSPYFDINHIKPFLEDGPIHVILSGLGLVCMNVIPVFLLLIIKKEEIHSDPHLGRKLFLFYTIAFLIILLENIFMVGVLGIYLVKLYRFPEYVILQKVSLFHFFDRVSSFFFIKWILDGVICLSLIIYHISKMFSKIQIRFSSFGIMTLMIVFSLTFFDHYSFFSVVCYYIFPLICFVLFFIYVMIAFGIFVRKII